MADFNCILDHPDREGVLYTEGPLDASNELCLHLGGLYNSFYPYDWLKITGCSSFKICIKGTIPKGKVTLFLHTPNKPAENIHELEVSIAGEAIKVEIADFTPLPGQRLTCQFESAEPMLLESVSWTAVGSTQRTVKLGIVICTYNNEARLKENIEALVASDVWHEEKPLLILANNGVIQDKSWYPSERFHEFPQENLGGSGGFGRGIYEVVYGQLQEQGITHILLMDDDVKFHPEVISRAITFHKKSQHPVVIGGAMLKLDDPTWLHEAGGANRVGGYTDVPVGPIQDTGALDFLGRGLESDYNAWWFCSFPSDAVRAIGLPLPLFIHGDDIEYGRRLQANGFPNFCPGGISLWHDSFEGKRLTWIRYFDCRNALIRLSTNTTNTKKEIIAEAQRRFDRFIIKNDYGACAMVIEAYRAFCQGPDVLRDKNFSTQIARLNQMHSEYTYPLTAHDYVKIKADVPGARPRKWLRTIKRWTTNLAYCRGSSRSLWKTANTRYAWWNIPFYADILVTTKDSSHFYPRDYKAARKLSKTIKEVTNQHSDGLELTIVEWQNHLPLFSSPEFWRVYILQAKSSS